MEYPKRRPLRPPTSAWNSVKPYALASRRTLKMGELKCSFFAICGYFVSLAPVYTR